MKFLTGFFNNMKMKYKLILVFMAIGLIPMSIAVYGSYHKTDVALDQATRDKLQAVTAMKKKQIESYYRERLADIRDLAGNPFVAQAFKDLDAVFIASDGQHEVGRYDHSHENYDVSPVYQKVHNKYFPLFKRYTEGYDDIFLMCPEHGHISFSANKIPDFAQMTSTVDSALRDVWRISAKQRRIALSDVEVCTLSNNMPVPATVRANTSVLMARYLKIRRGLKTR